MDSENSPTGPPSYTQSQLEALVRRLSDRKSTEDYDEFLARLLPLAEKKLGREVTLEEIKRMAEGDLPVELPNYKTMSRYDEVTKKRPEPHKAQTLPMSSKALDEPSLGGRSHSKLGTVTSAAKASEDSDSDSEVEKARIALLEAQKKRAERKKNLKARTVDDTLPRPMYAPQLSNHPPHLSPTGFPYSNIPWNSPVQATPFATPASPSAMSPTASEWSSGTGSGNVTYNVTADSYNDNSFRFTKRTGTKRKTGKDSSRLDFT